MRERSVGGQRSVRLPPCLLPCSCMTALACTVQLYAMSLSFQQARGSPGAVQRRPAHGPARSGWLPRPARHAAHWAGYATVPSVSAGEAAAQTAESPAGPPLDAEFAAMVERLAAWKARYYDCIVPRKVGLVRLLCRRLLPPPPAALSRVCRRTPRPTLVPPPPSLPPPTTGARRRRAGRVGAPAATAGQAGRAAGGRRSGARRAGIRLGGGHRDCQVVSQPARGAALQGEQQKLPAGLHAEHCLQMPCCAAAAAAASCPRMAGCMPHADRPSWPAAPCRRCTAAATCRPITRILPPQTGWKRRAGWRGSGSCIGARSCCCCACG